MKITWFLVALFWIASNFGYCHEFAPSLLKITELPQVTEERSRYSAVLKTPSRPDGLPMLTPEWPSSCETDRQTREQAAGATTLSNFLLSCSFANQSFSGKTIGVKGLGDTQTSAVVIVNLRDSRRYQERYPSHCLVWQRQRLLRVAFRHRHQRCRWRRLGCNRSLC